MDNTNAAEFSPQREARQQLRRFFHACNDEPPQMWMDELERLRESGANTANLYPLHLAAAVGRADVVQFMLGRGYDKDALDDGGRTPLHRVAAATISSVEVVQALLAAGADWSLRCHRGKPPLHVAAEKGQVDFARVLLEHGADANATAGDGSTPLHHAARCDKPDMVSLLCLYGAEADKHARATTPLRVAARLGCNAAARALLARGADATLRIGWNSFSPFDRAVRYGHVDVLVTFIEHGVDVNSAGNDPFGYTILHRAAMYGQTAAMGVLLGAGADTGAKHLATGMTPLSVATSESDVSAVNMLLKHGSPVNAPTTTGLTPLHIAALKAGRIGAPEIVDLLLRHGADEKANIKDGRTPADLVRTSVGQEDSVAEGVERVRKLLANAPADRAWRRRGFLVLCRAHFPGGRVQLKQGVIHGHETGAAESTRSRGGQSRAEAEWAGVTSMLMGVGADPISLMGDGADIIFETTVGFL